MSAQVITNAQVFVGSLEMSQWTGEYTTEQSTEMKDATTLAAGGYTVVLPGLSSFSMGLKGFADFAAGAPGQTFGPAQRGTQYAAGVVYAGTAAAAGDAATFTQGLLRSLKMATGSRGEVAAFDLGLTSDSPMVNGAVGATLASRTTSGLTGTAVAMPGPTAAQKLYAALYVPAAAGTNLVVKVQSDNASNFPSATDRITFSTMSATGWQFASVAGDFSSETHMRITATIASLTFSFAVLIGVM